MQHLKKILRLSVIQIWTKIESFFIKSFEKIEVYDFHLEKILRLSTIHIWTDIESFIYQKFWKKWSLWFSPQKMCKFLSNSVHFLDSHSRYAQNDSFTLGPTSFLKKLRIFRSLGGSCKDW